MRKISILVVFLALILALGGCSAPLRPSEQGAAVGVLGGAAAGGIIGAIAGNAGMGAGIGAGTGLIGGYLFGRHQEITQEAFDRGRVEGARGYYPR